MLRGAALLVTLGVCTTAVGAVAAPNEPAPPAPVTPYFITPTPDGTTSTLRIRPAPQNQLLTRFPMIEVYTDPSIDPIPTSRANPAYYPMRIIVPEGVTAPGALGSSALLPPARPPVAPPPELRFTPSAPATSKKSP